MMKPYPDYKDSGVAWLGQIPAHWKVKPLKHWARINQHALSETTNLDYEFEYMDIGSVSTGRLVKTPEKMHFGNAPSRARRILQKGDTIISTVRTYLKAIYYIEDVPSPLIASTGFAVLSPNVNVYPKFFSFVIQSDAFINAITANSVGIAYPAIAESRLGSFYLAMPDQIEEQRKIVQFLDDKCEKIDRFIANKQRMAALLREQKQAVITAAVTGKLGGCGKKPNAKDANGARDARAWFGDIPRHWEVRRLKTLFSIINGATPDSGNANYWDGDISWITPVDLHLVDGGIITNGRRNISELGYKNCGTTLLPSGSLVLSTRAPIGYVAITNNVLCTNQGCRGLIPKEQLNVEYFCFQLLALRPILQAFGNGSTFKELSTIPLGNLSVVKPSFQEQQEIVLYLKNTLHQIDRILARIEREIALMQEYRARLIADVVTGQIDAREKL